MFCSIPKVLRSFQHFHFSPIYFYSDSPKKIKTPLHFFFSLQTSRQIGLALIGTAAKFDLSQGTAGRGAGAAPRTERRASAVREKKAGARAAQSERRTGTGRGARRRARPAG